MLDKQTIHNQYIKTVKEIRSGNNDTSYNIGYAAALEYVLQYTGDEWREDIMQERIEAAARRAGVP